MVGPLDLSEHTFPLPSLAHHSPFDELTPPVQDLYLLDYYLSHVTQGLVQMPETSYAMCVGVPNLAAHHRGLLSSLLAIGAACLSVDILTNGVSSGIASQDIVELIRVGDRYHQQGLESIQYEMRMSINKRSALMLHLQSVMIFPYTLARRRVIRLLHSHANSPSYYSSSLPADLADDSPIQSEWLVCLRGITTIGLVSGADPDLTADASNDWYLHEHHSMDSSVSAQVLESISRHTQDLPDSSSLHHLMGSKHPLFPVVCATRTSALEKLHDKVNSLQRRVRSFNRREITSMSFVVTTTQQAYSASLAACTLAIDMLEGTADTLFEQYPEPKTEAVSGDWSTSWLRHFIHTPPVYRPETPMTRVILAWINRLPNEFVDTLLRPFPRTDSYCSQDAGQVDLHDVDLEIQLLAWDVYAHWLVFVILIEHECWWIADLGEFDIMKTREIFMQYSQSRNSEIAASAESENDYWPSSLCSIAQQMQKYHNPFSKM